MENELIVMTVAGVTLVGLFAAILYYFLRFFFKAGRYDEELTGRVDSTEATEETEPSETILFEKSLSTLEVESSSETTQPLELVRPEKPGQKDLSHALTRTRESLFGRIKGLFSSDHQLSSDDRESLEEILYTSDLGPKTVQRLMEAIDDQIGEGQKSDLEQVRRALKAEIIKIFAQVNLNSEENHTTDDIKSSEGRNDQGVSQVLHLTGEGIDKPQVWLVVGVNGVGKTTTIGKLAHAVAKSGKKVLVAAGDTFRAAAGDQLKVWSERAQVEIFSPDGVKDPSAVAFDACQMAKARDYDVVIVDTAGRLHTQANLMEELRKMKRVVEKVIPESPHETLLVLDANSGQNALVQARNFHDILELSGVVLTKMDGTAKGGVAVGLACELELPIRLIGVGEGIDDLRPFQSKEFVDSIL